MLYALIIVLVLGSSKSSKLRSFLYIAQIALGDAVAIRKGTYLKRTARKALLRKAGGVGKWI